MNYLPAITDNWINDVELASPVNHFIILSLNDLGLDFVPVFVQLLYFLFRTTITIYNSSKFEKMNWYKVGKTNSLKEGDIAKVKVGSMEIIIMNVKGNYYATSHLCTHEDYDLAEGFIDEGTLICPNHFATFNPKTGEVISPPEGSGDIEPLKSFKTKVENGEILVEA